MEKLDVFALLDELQEEIEMSPSKGMAKNKLVDPKIIMEILADMRQALHEELDFSRQVLQEKDQVISAAQKQADEIINRAKQDADELVKENAITRAAYDKATKMLENSKQRSLEIRKSANQYAEDIFNEMESYYSESIELIKENKARLNGKTTENRQPDANI